MTPRERPAANLALLVVDRSPIEGRAPALVSGLLPATTRAILGPLVEDMAVTPYPDLEVPGGRLGLVIEGRAGQPMRILRRPAERMGPIRFDADRLARRYEDVVHLPLSHEAIYTAIGRYGPALVRLFREGRFPDDVRREPEPGDPFRWCR